MSSFILVLYAGWARYWLRRCYADGPVRPGVRWLPAQQGVSPGQRQRQVPRPAGPARLQETKAGLETPWRLSFNLPPSWSPPSAPPQPHSDCFSPDSAPPKLFAIHSDLDSFFLLEFSSLCLLKYGFSVWKSKKWKWNFNLFLSHTLICIIWGKVSFMFCFCFVFTGISLSLECCCVLIDKDCAIQFVLLDDVNSKFGPSLSFSVFISLYFHTVFQFWQMHFIGPLWWWSIAAVEQFNNNLIDSKSSSTVHTLPTLNAFVMTM